jgi:hypothetical protein
LRVIFGLIALGANDRLFHRVFAFFALAS